MSANNQSGLSGAASVKKEFAQLLRDGNALNRQNVAVYDFKATSPVLR
jgi:hypothetical protein